MELSVFKFGSANDWLVVRRQTNPLPSSSLSFYLGLITILSLPALFCIQNGTVGVARCEGQHFESGIQTHRGQRAEQGVRDISPAMPECPSTYLFIPGEKERSILATDCGRTFGE